MDPAPEPVGLTDDERRHLGGYLACLAADLALRASVDRLGRLVEVLRRAVSRIDVGPDRDERANATLIDEARDVSAEVSRQLDRMRGREVTDYLEPLYRAASSMTDDEEILRFLDLLFGPCGEAGLIPRFIHDFRSPANVVSLVLRMCAVAGSPEDPDEFAENIRHALRNLGTLSLRFLDYDEVDPTSALRGLVGRVYEAFRHSDHQAKAAEIALARVSGLLESAEPLLVSREVLKAKLDRITSAFPIDRDPHVTPLVDLLYLAVPRERAVRILLDDPLVARLVERAGGRPLA